MRQADKALWFQGRGVYGALSWVEWFGRVWKLRGGVSSSKFQYSQLSRVVWKGATKKSPVTHPAVSVLSVESSGLEVERNRNAGQQFGVSVLSVESSGLEVHGRSKQWLVRVWVSVLSVESSGLEALEG